MGRTTRCSDLRLRHHCATLGAQLWAHELVHYGLCRPRLCTLRQVKTSAVSQCDGFDGRQCVFPALQSTVSSSLCLDSILVSFTQHSFCLSTSFSCDWKHTPVYCSTVCGHFLGCLLTSASNDRENNPAHHVTPKCAHTHTHM